MALTVANANCSTSSRNCKRTIHIIPCSVRGHAAVKCKIIPPTVRYTVHFCNYRTGTVPYRSLTVCNDRRGINWYGTVRYGNSVINKSVSSEIRKFRSMDEPYGTVPVPYCRSVSYRTVPYYRTLHRTEWYRTVPYRTVPYHTECRTVRYR